MLLTFTLKNYRSFKDEMVFSMLASKLSEFKERTTQVQKLDILPCAAIYGANSSGKSNLLSGFNAMKNLLLNSVKLNPDDALPYSPFLLDAQSKNEPTSFEVEFFIQGTLFRYGFTTNETLVLQEWLYSKESSQREYELFYRDLDQYSISKTRFKEGVGKESATASNRLFLSLVSQLNGELSKSILAWFSTSNVISGIKNSNYADVTLKTLLEDNPESQAIKAFIAELDLGFEALKVTKTPFSMDLIPNGLPEQVRNDILKDMSQKTILTLNSFHNVYHADGTVAEQKPFKIDDMESEGTLKIIEFSGPIFDTLLHGKTLFIDELDAKLHPILTMKLILLFNNHETNKKGAQLIFTTHDINLLDPKVFRRDQIWFTEKDSVESTELYSLVEFDVRKDKLYKNDYLKGRYGAIPSVNY